MTTPNYSSNELSLTVGRDLGDLKKYNEVASAVQPPAPGCINWPLGWNSPARQNRFEGVVPTRIIPLNTVLHLSLLVPLPTRASAMHEKENFQLLFKSYQ